MSMRSIWENYMKCQWGKYNTLTHIHKHIYLPEIYWVVIKGLSFIGQVQIQIKNKVLHEIPYYYTLTAATTGLAVPSRSLQKRQMCYFKKKSCTKFLTQQKPHAELNWINLCNWYHLPSSSSSFSISFFVWNWSPQNEKLQSLLVFMIWGNLYLCGSPDNASCSMAAPPLRCDMWVSVFKRNLLAV